jgi:hypothetical protein
MKNGQVSCGVGVFMALTGACGVDLSPPRVSLVEPQDYAMQSSRRVRFRVRVGEGHPEPICVTVYNPAGNPLGETREGCPVGLIPIGQTWVDLSLPAGPGTAFTWSARRLSCVGDASAYECAPETRRRFFVPPTPSVETNGSGVGEPGVTVGQVTDMDGDGQMDLVYVEGVSSHCEGRASSRPQEGCDCGGLQGQEFKVCRRSGDFVVLVRSADVGRYELIPAGRFPGDDRSQVLLVSNPAPTCATESTSSGDCTTRAWMFSSDGEIDSGPLRFVVHGWRWNDLPVAHRVFRGGRDHDQDGFFDLLAYGQGDLRVCFSSVPMRDQAHEVHADFVCMSKPLPGAVAAAHLNEPPRFEYVPQVQPGAPPRLIAAFKVGENWQLHLGTFSLTREGPITWEQNGQPIPGLRFDGRTLEVPADVDHDGHRDLVLTVPGPASHRGAVEAWSLQGTPHRIGNTLTGESAEFGHAISGGDTNDDGLDELYIGEPSRTVLQPGRIHRYELSGGGLVRVWHPSATASDVVTSNVPSSSVRLHGASFAVLPGRGLVPWPGSLPQDPSDFLSSSGSGGGPRGSGAILDLNRYLPIDTSDR